MTRRRRWLVAVVLAGSILPAGPAWSAVDLVDLEDEVMCVVCERPLKTSAGPPAEAQRALMQTLIAEGLTKDEIKDRLVEEYGDRVLVQDGSPVAAAAPIVAAVVGAGSIALLLRRRHRGNDAEAADDATDDENTASRTDADAPPPAVSAADEARIDAELAERR